MIIYSATVLVILGIGLGITFSIGFGIVKLGYLEKDIEYYKQKSIKGGIMPKKIDFDYTVKKAKEYQEVIKGFCEFLKENGLIEKWDEWAKRKNKEEEG